MAYGIDSSLLDRALAGDKPAMGEIVSALAPHVEKQLHRYPVSDEDRADLLQATLVQVVRRLGSFRGDASFSTWLFRVTANEALMMMRSQRRLRARVLFGHDAEELAALSEAWTGARPGNTLSADEELEEERARNVVRDAVRALPRSDREVVLAHYQDDLGLQEIAERLSLSESAVRSRLHRARAKLRDALGSASGAGAFRAAARRPTQDTRARVAA